MRWIEATAEPATPALRATLLRQAIAQAGARADRYGELGRALSLCGDHAGGAEAYEAALRLEPQSIPFWYGLAKAHLDRDDYDAVLAVCDRSGSPSPRLQYLRGRALSRLERGAEARTVLRAAVAGGSLSALQELLRLLAREEDATGLLALCDTAQPDHAATALVRAYRAIALCRAGRRDEAARLVDLERHVLREPISPPPQFGGIAPFNQALAEEILADPSPDTARRDGLDINYRPRVHRSPAFVALYAFMRDAMERYLAELPARGLADVMPPPPDTANFATANLVLRRDAANGEHIHGLGYLSCVYHVVVPPSVVEADDNRGALALGVCGQHTGGYAPCWGVRHIKPQAGWLTVFPSHVFHDVVPSGTQSPRISVVADMRPPRKSLKDTP